MWGAVPCVLELRAGQCLCGPSEPTISPVSPPIPPGPHHQPPPLASFLIDLAVSEHQQGIREAGGAFVPQAPFLDGK